MAQSARDSSDAMSTDELVMDEVHRHGDLAAVHTVAWVRIWPV